MDDKGFHILLVPRPYGVGVTGFKIKHSRRFERCADNGEEVVVLSLFPGSQDIRGEKNILSKRDKVPHRGPDRQILLHSGILQREHSLIPLTGSRMSREKGHGDHHPCQQQHDREAHPTENRQASLFNGSIFFHNSLHKRLVSTKKDA